MMKIKKLIVSLVAAAFSFVLCFILSHSFNVTVNAADSLPNLTVSAAHSEGTIFVPDTSGNIYLTLTLDKEATQDVIINFHAYDGTAVSEAGDYFYSGCSGSTNAEKAESTHTQTSVTISKGKKTTNINYKTTKAAFTTSKDGAYNRLTFGFFIDSVEGANFATNNYICGLNYSVEMPLNTQGSITYCSYYDTWGKIEKSTGDIGSDQNWGKYFYGNLFSSSSNRAQAIQTILKTNLGYIYMAFYVHAESHIVNCNDFNVDLYQDWYGDGKKVLHWDDDWFLDSDGWGWTVGNRTTHSADGHTYVRYDRSYYNDRYLIDFDNCSYWNRWASYKIESCFCDDDKAKITGYYIDSSTVSVNGTVRLAVRFNEPVQVSNSPSILAEYTAGKSRDVKFEYVGGSNTNTLVFATNISSFEAESDDKLIKRITFKELEHCEYVSDFGKNWNRKPNTFASNDSKTIITGSNRLCEPNASCNIDLRIPDLSIPSKNTEAITTQRTIDVTVDNMASGNLYYAWRQESTLILNDKKDYDERVIINKDGKASRVISITSPKLTGEYYLYVMVQSTFGKVTTTKFGRTTSQGVMKGGYLFDNQIPVLEEEDIYLDSLKQKVYIINAYDGTRIFDSGIESIYVNIAKNKDLTDALDPTLIWSNTSKKDSLGISPTGYELDSNAYTIYRRGDTMGYTSLSGYVLSSKEAAIEFIMAQEYTDFTFVELNSSNSSLKDKLAEGETVPSSDKSIYIVYKKNNFNFSHYNTSVTSANMDDYAYYVYSGTDITTFDVDLVSDNLKAAMRAVAETIVENGFIISDMIATGYLNETCTNFSAEAKANGKRNCINSIETQLNNITAKEEILYKDRGMRMQTTGGRVMYRLTATDPLIGLKQNQFGTYYIWFTTYDKVSNQSIALSQVYTVKYDTRELFDTSVEVKQNGELTSSIDNNEKAYNLDNGELSMTFRSILKETEEGTIGINNVYYQDDENPLDEATYSSLIDIGTIEKIGSTKDYQITLTFKNPGYYRIELKLIVADPTKGKISESYSFYLTRSYQEETLNYKNSVGVSVLNNRVFQLKTDYYYLDKLNKVQHISYNNIYKEIDPELRLPTLNATFSSVQVAKEYVRYMEYQDMTLVVLNQATADNLNNGNANKEFVKASEENHEASVGEAWIKYKRRTWTESSTEYDWVYYYYGPKGTTTISASNFSMILTQAIDDVVIHIIGNGSEVNLVGDEYCDEYGAPYLDETQKHYAKETKQETRNGSLCVPELVYGGDIDIYKATITDFTGNISQEIPLVSNSKLYKENLNKVYFAYYNGTVEDVNELEFEELDYKAGSLYRDSIPGGSGTYIIREFGKEGANQYKIYIDNSAPAIFVSYTSAKDDKTYSAEFDSSIDGSTYSAKRFTIGSIDSGKERDTLSYVTIYNKNTMSLIETYFYDELENDFIDFETGEYLAAVGDRSGNIYTFTILVNDQPLIVDVQVIDNDYVQVSINRTENQVYLYEVYLNNNPVPIDRTWTGTKKKYKDSGYYRIVVRDIYDFYVEIGGESGYAFERELPKITWSYLGDDGNYHKYEQGKTSCMRISNSLGTTFYVNTSKKLRFTMDGEYEFTINGVDSKLITTGFTGKVVTIDSTDNWDMEIHYKDYPEISATYVCTMDTMAPEISLSYKSASWSYSDNDYAQNHASQAKEGEVYTPLVIDYYKSREITSSISEGEIVNSSLIRLELNDASGVARLEVYLDDKLLSLYTNEKESISGCTLSRFGTYNIIAYDVFENKRSFTFTNNVSYAAEGCIDGAAIEPRYSEVLYGHDSMTMTFIQNGTFASKVVDSNGTTYVNFYNVTDGEVTIAQYICKLSETSTGIVNEFVLQDKTEKGFDSLGNVVDLKCVVFSNHDVSYKVNKWYQLLTYKNDDGEVIDGYNLYVMYDSNKNIVFKVECLDEKAYFEIRGSFKEDVEPFLYKAYLSHELSPIELLNKDETFIKVVENGVTYTNQDFTIVEPLNEDITLIEISYSDRNEFNEFEKLYPNIAIDGKNQKIILSQYDTSVNGFYRINVYNKYGNVNEMTINRSDVLVLLTEARYKDGEISRFNDDFEGITKANFQVSFEAYSNNATFEVTKDGVPHEVIVEKANGVYYILFALDGDYVVTCHDLDFGNVESREIMINHSTLSYKEDLIEGYNELALRKAEGYTNQVLTIVSDKVEEYNIKYISIVYDGNETIIYNALNQYVVPYDKDALVNSIGKSGNGVYEIIFKDEFGSKASKTINYRLDPSISVSRKISSSNAYEIYDINDVVSNGIWSNSIIVIDTVASKYILTIDDEEAFCPCTKSLLYEAGAATIYHHVTYIDEYGFAYEFEANLEKKDLTFKLDSTVALTSIDKIDYTRNNVIALFDEGTCTYTLDGSESIQYNTGDLLKRDGYYRFTLVDRAGNSKTLAVKKDTFVDFSFIDDDNGRVLVYNDVVNKGPIEFVANNKDEVTISALYIDGLKQTTIPKTFKAHGQYTVYLTDKIGNEALFEFYILTHEICEFNYDTPNSYIITDASYSIGDGNFVSIMNTNAIEDHGSYSTLKLTENGLYQFTMTSSVYSMGITFSLEIDNTAPEIELVGCKENEVTIEDITITGYQEGDIIFVYRNGELISTTEVVGTSFSAPVIDEGGKYEVVVRNRSGVSTTLRFERKYIANESGSALIIIVCVAISIGILIGVILRNKQKFDE